jgi:beta-phosphoglucomutase
MLQAIIFDFDGIIVDSEPLHFRATQIVLASLGIVIDFSTYLNECVGQPDLINLQRICAKHQLKMDEEQILQLIKDKIQHYRQLIKTNPQACRGVIPLIKSAAAHFPLAICSGSYKNEISQLLTMIDQEEDLNPYFKHLVSIEDVPAGKPDPAGYRLTAQQLGALPEFCLAIEDSPAGIIAAKTAGMTVLAVTTTHPREKLSLADHCIDSLADITLADLNQICYA